MFINQSMKDKTFQVVYYINLDNYSPNLRKVYLLKINYEKKEHFCNTLSQTCTWFDSHFLHPPQNKLSRASESSAASVIHIKMMVEAL